MCDFSVDPSTTKSRDVTTPSPGTTPNPTIGSAAGAGAVVGRTGKKESPPSQSSSGNDCCFLISSNHNNTLYISSSAHGGVGGGRAELFTGPCPLKVQARPPRDQRLATRSRVSGRLAWAMMIVYLTTHSTHFIYGYMASDIW